MEGGYCIDNDYLNSLKNQPQQLSAWGVVQSPSSDWSNICHNIRKGQKSSSTSYQAHCSYVWTLCSHGGWQHQHNQTSNKLLQHIKVILQNKLTICRAEISLQLIKYINTPVHSHKQVMQFHEWQELLISMKESANSLPYQSCNEGTAHNVVNTQSESDKHVPFSTEQASIEMARVLGEYKLKSWTTKLNLVMIWILIICLLNLQMSFHQS